MCLALKKRYKEKRLIEASIKQYLANAETYFTNLETDDLDLFSRPNSAEMCSKIVDLLGCASRDIGQSDLLQDHLEP